MKSKELKLKETRKKIKSLQVEAELLEGELYPSIKEKVIKKLEEYSAGEKIEKFNEIYELAESCLQNREDDAEEMESDEGFAFETVMELLAKNKGDFWNFWNSIEGS